MHPSIHRAAAGAPSIARITFRANEFRARDSEIIHPTSRSASANVEVAAGNFSFLNEGKTPARLMAVTAAIADVTPAHEMQVDARNEGRRNRGDFVDQLRREYEGPCREAEEACPEQSLIGTA